MRELFEKPRKRRSTYIGSRKRDADPVQNVVDAKATRKSHIAVRDECATCAHREQDRRYVHSDVTAFHRWVNGRFVTEILRDLGEREKNAL